MKHLSLGYQVLVAVIAGIFIGFFFGPLANVLKPLGDIFIMLLQMVVLPYILFSIIHGLGSIAPKHAKLIFKKGWPFWVLLWGLMFFIVFLLSQTIPKAAYGAFIPVAKNGGEGLSKNILAYLIPENPFYDLVNNIVPSIAIFGVIVGIALMHIEKKEPMLSLLERGNQVIEKILQWLTIISPIGVFAHIAVVVGTVNFEDLYKLEFYVVAFILATLVVVFWILPLVLSIFTPISFTEALKAFRTVCLLSFVTGVPTIAIPFINRYLRKTEEKYQLRDHEFHSTSQTVMPIAYAFGQIGNCLILFFILFIAFYYRHPFTGSEKTLISILTMPLSIGSSATSINAVSFLVEQLGFPGEAVELFTQTMAVTLNFQVLASVAGILTFILLVLFAYYNLLKINWKNFAFHLGGGLAALTILVFAITPHLNLQDNYRHLYMNLQLSKSIPKPVEAKIYQVGDPIEPRPYDPAPQNTVLKRILATGVLRVGYDPVNIPYCYFNNRGELVGYDVAMAYQLAKDLDCTLEFVPLQINQLVEELNGDLYDTAMSAILMSEERIQRISFSHFYSEQDNVLVVPAKMKSKFSHYEEVAANRKLTIGAIGAYVGVRNRHFPHAIHVNGPVSLLPEGKVDAWVWSHIPAFVWCLNNPGYVVETYPDQMGKLFFAYPVKMNSFEFLSFMNNWLELKTQTGFLNQQYQYWIVGAAPGRQTQHRWSIIRNVLHWID